MKYQQINDNIRSFIEKNPELTTPFVVIDTDEVVCNWQRLKQAFSYAQCFYSLKANPANEVLLTLNAQGSYFDVASIYEIEQCIALGIPGKYLHYGNTIKKYSDIQTAFKYGVQSFIFDSQMELDKLAKAAPNAKVYARMATTGQGAAWSLSEKFGGDTDSVFNLLVAAKKQGLQPWGISFHVGSQQLLAEAWKKSIAEAAQIRARLQTEGIKLHALNIGGGFPVAYQNNTPDIEVFSQTIKAALLSHGMMDLQIILEPGRYIVASAGILQSEVILVRHNEKSIHPHWVYLDVGVYNGLTESCAIILQVITHKDDCSPVMDTVLAGPTCDSVDIIAKGHTFQLPNNLTYGDRVFMLNAGAYTTSYSTVNFNGFPPLKQYFVGQYAKDKY
ncbi:MAG: type III PLP-dependent enzyme [Thiomargarita sp.]|nr:type III PLP-dependent enzyme [Thiomargarita sp.]